MPTWTTPPPTKGCSTATDMYGLDYMSPPLRENIEEKHEYRGLVTLATGWT